MRRRRGIRDALVAVTVAVTPPLLQVTLQRHMCQHTTTPGARAIAPEVSFNNEIDEAP
jgi:hypothetical protein